MNNPNIKIEEVSQWHTERVDYDYRYHWGKNFPEDNMEWWVEYRNKERKGLNVLSVEQLWTLNTLTRCLVSGFVTSAAEYVMMERLK